MTDAELIAEAASYRPLTGSRIVAQLAAALDARQWQPIETAPKDGTELIVYGSTGHYGTNNANCIFACFHRGQWRTLIKGHALKPAPTHWMPLPTPPEAKTPPP